MRRFPKGVSIHELHGFGAYFVSTIGAHFKCLISWMVQFEVNFRKTSLCQRYRGMKWGSVALFTSIGVTVRHLAVRNFHGKSS